MNFNRREVQKWWENKCGCLNPENWTQYKSTIATASLNILDIPVLEEASNNDRRNYGINAMLSFLEAIESIRSRHFAWGIVKLYYSVFYALRYEILLSGHILLRCKGLYRLRLHDSEHFIEIKDNKKSGDHQLTIKAERQLVESGLLDDPVLSNEIEGESPYLWLMSQRERVNYREACFPDPECDECIQHPYDDYISVGRIAELFELYTHDKLMAFVFDKEHSMISIPFYRVTRIVNSIEWEKVDTHTKDHIKSICSNIGIKSFVQKMLPTSASTDISS